MKFFRKKAMAPNETDHFADNILPVESENPFYFLHHRRHLCYILAFLMRTFWANTYSLMNEHNKYKL